MEKKLLDAIKKIHGPDDWVHFSSIGPDGGHTCDSTNDGDA